MDSGASMHNAEQRRIKLRYNGYFRKVQKPQMRLAATGCSANHRVSTSFCSWSRSVRNSAITRWNASDSYASSTLLKTRIFIWVENGETPHFAKNDWTTQYFSLHQDCHHIPAAVCLRHRDQRIGPIIPGNCEHCQIQQRLEVTSTHVGNRCWHITTGNREPADETNKEDPTQGIHVWLQPFTVSLEDVDAQCPHIPLQEKTQIRKVMLQKWRHKNGSTVFMLTSAKKPKRSILRTGKYGDLTTAEHKVLNEGRESRNNHRYAVVVQFLAIQWNPCNTKTLQETEKNSWKFPEPSQRPFRRTFYYNLASIVKNYHGIIEQPHFIDQKQAELQNELYVEWKKWHQPYYCNLDRLISGGWILWHATVVCEMTKTSWQTGNLKMNEDLENPSRTCFVRGWNLGRSYSDCWDWRTRKVRCISNISQKTECERRLDNPKKMENLFFLWYTV